MRKLQDKKEIILWIPGYRISSDFTANETTKNKLWISVWEGEKNERTY